MSSTITVTLVCHSDTSIDEAGSLAAFKMALSKHISELETEQATIAEAVSSVFDAHKGVKVNMPYLVSQTLTALSAQPENFKSLTGRVQDYVRANAGEGGLFSIGKGKGGGVGRIADLPSK